MNILILDNQFNDNGYIPWYRTFEDKAGVCL